jgi:type I restriction enzyme R subunit
MIEFKQIVGRGTRLFDGKEYFTIYDFVDAYKHFSDPEWDGDPIEEETEKAPRKPKEKGIKEPVIMSEPPEEQKKKLKIKLRDGKEREIQHMISTSFWDTKGKPISAEDFLKNIFGTLPEFFKNEDELRAIWANPITRRVFLFKMSELGYDQEKLESLQNMINADDSDLFDVLAYVSFAIQPITREERVSEVKSIILEKLNDNNLILYNELVNKKEVFESVGMVEKFNNEEEIRNLVSKFDYYLVPDNNYDLAPFYVINLEACNQTRDYLLSQKESFELVNTYTILGDKKLFLMRNR